MYDDDELEVEREQRRCKRCKCFLRSTNGESNCDPCIMAMHKRKGKYEDGKVPGNSPEYELMRKLKRDLKKLGLKLVKA